MADAAPRLPKAAHYARRAMKRADAVVLRGDMVALLPGELVTVDVEDFETAAAAARADGSPAAAASVLDAYPGEPLPADLYAEWAGAPRDRVAALRHELLRQARRWRELVELDPLDEQAHVEPMRELARDGDRHGALQQFEHLDRAMRRELGTAPGPAATALRDEVSALLRDLGRMSPADAGRLEQQIRFCRTGEGVTLAYACSGNGPPPGKAANWLTHLDHDWHSPVWRHWLVELSRHHQLVRYDERGCGLSDWDIPTPTFESWVADLEALVDAMALRRFPLLGISQGGRGRGRVRRPVPGPGQPARPLRHVRAGPAGPQRQRGRAARARTAGRARTARLGPGRPGLPAGFASQFMPDGSRELWEEFNERQRLPARRRTPRRWWTSPGPIDVRAEATRVRAPTLVLLARDDQRVPFEQGRLAASLIPGSRFVALDSRNHVLLADEPAWPVFLREVEAFLAV